MIKKGDLVKSKPWDYCVLTLGLSHKKLSELYPPESSVCLVVVGVRETDLSTHSRYWNPKNNLIELKKSIHVIFDSKVYGPCDVSVFEPIRK